ncbi:MAG: TetR/AcrR family transcriptional regulator [Phascolarctobacterium sp.]|nr:TetR/AcrR family transcriptional regulator [Phascolarctobacterium sp.]
MELSKLMPKDERILQAAEEIFSMYGYEKATLDEIIKLADVGKGTVYKYFGNKEQLFYKLVSDKNKPFVERLKKATASGTTLAEKMHAYFQEFVAFYYENSALWQIICFEMLGASSACRVQRVDGVYRVLPRYSQVEISSELEERILRYHELLQAEYFILEDIIREGYDKGLIKECSDLETSVKYVFFGVAMSIFNPTQSLKQEFTPERAADIIVDRYLFGEGEPSKRDLL